MRSAYLFLLNVSGEARIDEVCLSVSTGSKLPGLIIINKQCDCGSCLYKSSREVTSFKEKVTNPSGLLSICRRIRYFYCRLL